MKGNEWYDRQKRFDAESRRTAESVLGPEANVFADSMAMITHCLDRVAIAGPPNDLPTKRKIALTVHAFNLLWSAWDATLAGRYDAAASHWRSIEETGDFLMALYADPSCAERMGDQDWDVHRARRVVTNAMEKDEKGKGREWLAKIRESSRGTQPFSHISLEAQGMTLGIVTQDGKKIGVLRPGGAPAYPTLRLAAVYLAFDAVMLLGVVAVAFSDVRGLEDLWEGRVRGLTQSWSAVVRRELQAMSVPTGEMDSIVLLRSDEAPPDPVVMASKDNKSQ